MTLEPVRKNDGLWHSTNPANGTAQIVQFRREENGGVVKYNKPVWRGVVTRCVGGRWISDTCPHNHHKRSAARRCGEAAARRLNRLEAKVEQQFEDAQ